MSREASSSAAPADSPGRDRARRPQRLESRVNLATILFFVGLQASGPYVAQFAVALGASEAQVALLGPAIAATALGLRLLTGALLDRGLAAHALVAGAALACVSQALLVSANGLGEIYASRALQGLGLALFMPTTMYVAAMSGESAARAIAWRSAAVGFSMALGPAIGGYVVASRGYRAAFAVSLAIVLASLSLCATMLSRLETLSGRAGADLERRAQHSALSRLLTPRFLVPTTVVLLHSMSFNSMTLFLPALHKLRGIDPHVTGGFFVVFALATLPPRVLMGVSRRRVDERATGILGLTLSLLGALLTAADPLSRRLTAYAAIAGLGMGFVVPSLQSLALLGVEPRVRGLASGVYTAMFDVGSLAGPPLFVAMSRDYSRAIEVSALFYVVPLALFASSARKIGR
ncbi:MAG: MFS transporter [Fervidicoccaceae archaeon]